MLPIAEYSYRVQPLDVDFKEQMRTTQLLGYMLHTAGQHADENGFGIHTLHSTGRAWVASRIAMEIDRYPMAEEAFHIQTWIEDFGRVFTTRNFRFLNANREEIGGGTSIWCMLDMESRKAIDLAHSEYASFANGIPSPVSRAAKVAGVQAEAISRHRVKYSDLDFNHHANSMKYIEWMMDLFPLEFFQTNAVKRLDINYVSEIRFGEIVDIYRQQDAADRCRFDMRRGDGVICRTTMHFHAPFSLI